MADEQVQSTAPEFAPEPTAPSADSAAHLATETPASDDPWAKLADTDPDEIIRRFPKLQGKIGQLAQTQAQKQVQARLAQLEQDTQRRAAEAAEQRRREEMLRLSQSDPDELARRVQQDIAEQDARAASQAQWSQVQQQMVEQLQGQLNDVYSEPLVREILAEADDATKAKMDWRNYASFSKFAVAVAEIVADHKAGSKAEQLAAARVSAAIKEAGIESMQSEAEAHPDLGLGVLGTGARRYKASEVKAMSLTEYKKHEAAIEQAMASGTYIDDLETAGPGRRR